MLDLDINHKYQLKSHILPKSSKTQMFSKYFLNIRSYISRKVSDYFDLFNYYL